MVLEHSFRRISYVVFALLLSGAIFVPLAGHATAQTQSSSGLIIPLYSYPSSQWDAILQEKAAYPTLPIMVIVNPSNGPGYYDPNYASWIQKFQAAGITVLGYVYSDYASRNIGSVESDISTYVNAYGVNGIFIDQMSNVPGNEWYYSSLTSYAHSLGLWPVVGNAGAAVPLSYIGTVDIIVVYEDAGLPSAGTLAVDTMGFSSSQFAFISYDVPSISASDISSLDPYVGYLFATDGTLPSPYSSLPSYFSSLVADMPSSASTVTVQSTDLSGDSITGLWVTVQSGGATVATGFTPFTFSGTVGTQYVVTAYNYGNYNFSNWQDGTTDPSYTLTLSGPTSLTAAYSNGTAILNVQSLTTSSTPLTGMWVTIFQGGTMVDSGFTSLTYLGTLGSSYTVCAAGYGDYSFSHWDNWSTSACRSVTLSQNLWLTAIYST